VLLQEGADPVGQGVHLRMLSGQYKDATQVQQRQPVSFVDAVPNAQSLGQSNGPSLGDLNGQDVFHRFVSLSDRLLI
jgi:hypothetical protein